MWHKLVDLYYQVYHLYREVRSKIKYAPNRLHIKTLKRGWTDCDYQLLHACMQILCNFVEGEMDNVDWDFSSDHSEVRDALMEVYRWWKNDPLAQNDSLIYNYGNCLNDLQSNILSEYNKRNVDPTWVLDAIKDSSDYYKALYNIETALSAKRKEMLTKLINVREYMWT